MCSMEDRKARGHGKGRPRASLQNAKPSENLRRLCIMANSRPRPTAVLQVTRLGAGKLPFSGEKWADGRGKTCTAHERRQPLHELQRRNHRMRRAVAPWRLQLQHHLPGGIALHAVSSDFIANSGARAARQASRQAVGGLYAERAALAVFTILAWASRSKISCVSRLQIAPEAPPAVESAAAATPSG